MSASLPGLTLTGPLTVFWSASTFMKHQGRHGYARHTVSPLGWTDDRNIRTDSRSGGDNADDIRKHATELTALAPDAIMVSGTAAVGEEFRGITTDSAKNART
jgi:hypothetical protein